MPPTDAPSPARSDIARPWFAIGWFLVWGLFHARRCNGTWERPAAFPGGVYEALWQVGAGMKPSSLPVRD